MKEFEGVVEKTLTKDACRLCFSRWVTISHFDLKQAARVVKDAKKMMDLDNDRSFGFCGICGSLS